MDPYSHNVRSTHGQIAEKKRDEARDRKVFFQMIKPGAVFSCLHMVDVTGMHMKIKVEKYYLAEKPNCAIEWQVIELNAENTRIIYQESQCKTIEITLSRRIKPLEPIFEKINEKESCLIPIERVKNTRWQWEVLPFTEENIELIFREADLTRTLIHFQEMNQLKIHSI
ncbi:MAG: hypothetical protein V1928_01240 [Parcubacteria group bacterium]